MSVCKLAMEQHETRDKTSMEAHGGPKESHGDT